MFLSEDLIKEYFLKTFRDNHPKSCFQKLQRKREGQKTFLAQNYGACIAVRQGET